MFRKILAVGLLLLSLNIRNGQYNTTRIAIEGIDKTCYGTLLSSKTISGSFSTQNQMDLNAPDKVIEAFKEYKDEYYYLNYFQDVSEGLLYWHIFPPKEFKLLLYFPDTDTFIESEPLERYALTSEYKAVVDNNSIKVFRNYNYFKLSVITLIRIIIGVVLSVVVSALYGKPNNDDMKLFILTNTIFQTLLNVGISIYGFKNGFGIVEYYLFLWFIYVIFFVIQAYIYQTKTISTYQPIVCAFLGNIATYFAGLFLVDIIPSLFNIL